MKKLALLALLWSSSALAQPVNINNLPSATIPLVGTEVFPLVQNGTTKKSTISGLFNSVNMTKSWTLNNAVPFGPGNTNLYNQSSPSGTSSSSTYWQTNATEGAYAQPSNLVNCNDSAVIPLGPIGIGAPNVGSQCFMVNQNILPGAAFTHSSLEVGQYLTSPGVTAAVGNDFILPIHDNVFVNQNVGGTSGTQVGNLYGLGTQAVLGAGATYWNGIIGAEFDVGITPGASANAVYGIAVANFGPASAPHGAITDAGVAIYRYGGNTGWNDGIMFGQGCCGTFGVTTTGTIITTNDSSATVANGVDLSGVTITGNAYKSVGFSVSGSGALTTTGVNTFATGANNNFVIQNVSGYNQLLFKSGAMDISGGSNSDPTMYIDFTNAGGVQFKSSGAAVTTQSLGGGLNVQACGAGCTEQNWLALYGSPTNVAPTIRGSGNDTNVGLQFQVQAAGSFIFNTNQSTNVLINGVSNENFICMIGDNCTGMYASTADHNLRINSQSGGLYFEIGNLVVFGLNSTASVFPITDNATSLGFASTGRWSNVYAVTYTAGANVAGVTCSGTPTASFAATGGIVTHC